MHIPCEPSSTSYCPTTSSQPQTPSTPQNNNTSQQPTEANPIEKRGRKASATTMPVSKKHYQNITNQRIYCQRRANYIRNLEIKVSTFETLYFDAQDEINLLREKLALLEE
ncbi:18897_t:CDS:2 [Funneliformis geosporum]|uniref:1205_t:CDS:1 n=1 Tax=Funneliformis geosporum TaxID=1117311 RepID=A0A9W4SYM6_9GLOM|nr:1205_t:CDS:2 [Funneliformis geosporum]CAI2190583.1 18897_t:CDS:2 [Funneliformis geosporum]